MSKQQPMDGKSQDLKAEKLEALNKQFPELFSEGKLDVEKLKQSLDEDFVTGDERYRLEWAGKHKVFEEIAKRTTSTLTPDIERSVDFENSQNVFIEGENLEVLRTLQKAYYNKVKMIYIDPPYNTGKDFVYNDNFRETVAEYDEAAGNLDDNGNLAKAFTLNSKDSGQYHSNWLNMMYPRLFLARNLLRDDGVIFVSIDDNEVHNLRMLMNEIFGEENFVTESIWQHSIQPKGYTDNFSIQHNYTLVYQKGENFKLNSLERTVEHNKNYSNPDNDLNGPWRSGDVRNALYRPNLIYTIETPSGEKIEPPKNGWRWSKETLQKKIDSGEIIFTDNETKIKRKIYLNNVGGRAPETIWFGKEVGTTRDASSEVKELFDGAQYFDTPKPTTLLQKMFEIAGCDDNVIVLDFFAGSGTLADAVMQTNAQDMGQRQYICVQLPERVPENSEARKAGYETIADIAIERIKRAAKKIKEENPEFNGDLGVKVYTQTPSHFPAWRAESFESDEALQLNLGSFAEQKAVGEAGARAIELLLKLGYDLNTELEEKAGYYSAAKGEVLLVVDEKAKVDLEKLLTEKPSVVVVLEDVFKGDDAKINFALACKERNVTFQTV